MVAGTILNIPKTVIIST